MEYGEKQQKDDLHFLVGAAYARQAERARILKALKSNLTKVQYELVEEIILNAQK